MRYLSMREWLEEENAILLLFNLEALLRILIQWFLEKPHKIMRHLINNKLKIFSFKQQHFPGL